MQFPHSFKPKPDSAVMLPKPLYFLHVEHCCASLQYVSSFHMQLEVIADFGQSSQRFEQYSTSTPQGTNFKGVHAKWCHT